MDRLLVLNLFNSFLRGLAFYSRLGTFSTALHRTRGGGSPYGIHFYCLGLRLTYQWLPQRRRFRSCGQLNDKRDKKSLIDPCPLSKSVWRLAAKNIQFHSQVPFDPYMLQMYGAQSGVPFLMDL